MVNDHNYISKECYDHKGKKFPSKKARARHYNLSVNAIDARLNKGWSLEKALTTKQEKGNSKKCTDHLGNVFKSKKEKYEFWGINPIAGMAREKFMDSTEEILTTPYVAIKSNKEFTDHLGNIFKDEATMYESWGIPHNVALKRKYAKWPLEKILTTPIRKIFVDPITGSADEAKNIAEKYGITYQTYYSRLTKGYSDLASTDISFCIGTNCNNINLTKYNLTVVKRIQKGKDVFECYIDNGDGTSTFKIMSYDMIDEYCLEQYKKLHNVS